MLKIKLLISFIGILLSGIALAHVGNAVYTSPMHNFEQLNYLKVRAIKSRSAVDENAVAIIYSNGSSAVNECVHNNDGDACQQYRDALSELVSACKSGYSQACDSAHTLDDFYVKNSVHEESVVDSY